MKEDSAQTLVRSLGARTRPGKSLLEIYAAALTPQDARIKTFSTFLRLLELHLGSKEEREILAGMAAEAPEALNSVLPSTQYPSAHPGGAIPELFKAVARAARAVKAIAWPAPTKDTAIDFLGPLYQDFLPTALRRKLGEHYTPSWVVERLFQGADWPTTPDSRLLDPACGSGVFLIHALAYARQTNPKADPEQWLSSLRGVDIQPHAVRAARLNLQLALRDIAGPLDLTSVIQQGDALQQEPPIAALQVTYSHIKSNPPWVTWQNLSVAQRTDERTLWDTEGLFAQLGWQARMGGGKKDLSMLFVAVACSRWLAPGGSLAMVLPHSLATSAAAKGLRRRLSQGPLTLDRIEDLSRISVFPGVAAKTLLLCAHSNEPARNPVQTPSWIEWRAKSGYTPELDLEQVLTLTTRTPLSMIQLEGAGTGAPWVAVPIEARSAVQSIVRPAHYQGREGANTGGANGILWIEKVQGGHAPASNLIQIRNVPGRGRRQVPQKVAWIEAEFVWPLLRGRDVRKWSAAASTHLLLVQDPNRRRGIALDQLRRKGPRTLDFLTLFRAYLEARPLYQKYFNPNSAPWYSIYNVGPYTLKPWKVVWREQASRLTAAVVGPTARGRVAIPDHKLMFVACEHPAEAHFICAVLNSTLCGGLVSRIASLTSTGPHILKHLAVPRYDPERPVHRALRDLSETAHRACLEDTETSTDFGKQASTLVAQLWGMEHKTLQALLSLDTPFEPGRTAPAR